MSSEARRAGSTVTETEAKEAALHGGRIFQDPSVPELLCRYPTEAIVTILERREGEVLVELNGRPRRVAVRNPELAEVGRQYLLIRDGADQGLWQLLE